MKTIWKGSLSFGLVTIDIELYSAVQAHSFGFTLLHETCKTPIHYKRWCSHCNKEVSWHEVVKGIKLNNGKYFIITPENLKKLKPEKTDTIAITEVVDAQAINPIYYDQHYYAVPTKKSANAFAVLFTALQQQNYSAIGHCVLREKEYVCSLQPYENILLLSTLNYDYEIRSINTTNVKPVKAESKKELELAQLLLKKLYKKKFDISKFHDTFVQKLKEKIKQGARTARVSAPHKKTVIPKDLSLAHKLQESLSKLKTSRIRARA